MTDERLKHLPEGCYTIPGPDGLYLVDLQKCVLRGPDWEVLSNGYVVGSLVDILYGPDWFKHWTAKRIIRKRRNHAWFAARHHEEGPTR